jgi:hypothetical protein
LNVDVWLIGETLEFEFREMRVFSSSDRERLVIGISTGDMVSAKDLSLLFRPRSHMCLRRLYNVRSLTPIAI